MEKEKTTSKIKLEDIYFVVFRRKWMILAFLAAGIIGAGAIWKTWTPAYMSHAELLVRYVVETGVMQPPGSDEKVQQVNIRGGSPLNTELEILSSADLATEVARTVGPQIILGTAASQDDSQMIPAAAGRILGGLQVTVSGKAPVILISYSHPVPEVSQQVLQELIQSYLKLHAKIHLSGATYDALAKEADERKLRLRQTEEQLQALRAEMGGVSLDDAKSAVASEIQGLRKAILGVETELETQEAIAGVSAQTNAIQTSGSTTTNLTTAGDNARTEKSDLPVNDVDPYAEQVAYQGLMGRLKSLRAREQDYLGRFTEENPLVKSVRAQIVGLEARARQMLKDNPQLALQTQPRIAPQVLISNDLFSTTLTGQSSVGALKARLDVLKAQLEKARAESLRISDLERRMADIQLSREIQSQGLRYLATKLEQERYDSALDSTKNSNINVLQEPSNPSVSKVEMQKQAAIVFGALAGSGLVLAFLIELFLDPRIKRPAQLEAAAGLPVYISIPKQHPRLRSSAVALLPHPGQTGSSANRTTGDSPGGDDSMQPMAPAAFDVVSRSYLEALRDRLIVFFERVNLRRKPKLVGVTGCHSRAGVSTIAEGLAATLSETGGGRVLLVDLNHGQESVHSYHAGRPSVTLPDALLQPGAERDEQSKGTLQLASFGSNNGGYHPTRTREFDLLIPKLKASDFDYVVFDMPPLTPTSVTFRVAGFMDKVLVVAESERTHTASLKRTVSLLQETNSRVSLVMNKAHEYLPKWLRPPE